MTRAPYSVLAPFYDEVYATWRAFLGPARDEILRAHRVPCASVLDLGCGSGWQSLELARRGSRVLAVDPVRAFLAPLRRTARAEGLDVRVRHGELLAVPADPGEAFDLVLSTFDVFNHLPRHADLAPALAEVARVTRPGGHLLFDVNTQETIAGVSGHHRVSRLASGGLSAETGRYDEASGRATVERDWFLPAPGRRRGVYLRLSEAYVEIAWTRGALVSALRAAGFLPRLFADAAGWLSFLPEGSRWIVLARRTEEATRARPAAAAEEAPGARRPPDAPAASDGCPVSSGASRSGAAGATRRGATRSSATARR